MNGRGGPNQRASHLQCFAHFVYSADHRRIKFLELYQLLQGQVACDGQAEVLSIDQIDQIKEPLGPEIRHLEFVNVILKEMVAFSGTNLRQHQ